VTTIERAIAAWALMGVSVFAGASVALFSWTPWVFGASAVAGVAFAFLVVPVERGRRG
jgi:hypothetical protein